MNRELDLARFCLWMLTMSEAEAAVISQQVAGYRDNKEKVAAFTVMYYRSTH